MKKTEASEKIRELYNGNTIPSPTVIAKILGIGKRTVYRRIKEMGLPLKVGAPNGWQPIQKDIIKDYSQGIVELTGNAIIAGDWHSPFYNRELSHTVFDVSNLLNIKTLIINGDLMDQAVFSFFDKRNVALTWSDEADVTRDLCNQLFTKFEKIVILPGNHTLRILRLTNFQLTFRSVLALLESPLDNVVVSEHDFCILKSGDQVWRITHPKSFSQLPLRVENKIALKTQQNIIGGHGHRLSIGHDDSGKHRIASGGGMFDKKYFDYISLIDSIYPEWNAGFFAVVDGWLLPFEEGFPFKEFYKEKK